MMYVVGVTGHDEVLMTEKSESTRLTI